MQTVAQPGRFIAVVGPSGVGKDSIMNGLAAADPRFKLCRRVITRSPDAGGEDFEGVTQAQFETYVERGDFALWWEAHGLAYGIPRTSTTDALNAGSHVLANLSRNSLREAHTVFPTLTVLSITAPIEVLAKRLEIRGRETADDIAARLKRPTNPLPKGMPVVTVDNSGDLMTAVRQAREGLANATDQVASV